MSTVFEVEAITVDGGNSFALGTSIDSIVITDTMTPPDVTIDTSQPVESVMVEVPGIQGPPGLQNVYPQPNDPAVEYGWGAAEAGYIWIEVNV